MDKITVIYNGACPICSREVAMYRAEAARDAPGVGFADLNETDLSRWGLDADAAAKRLHVAQEDGRLLSGFAAFVRLWEALPRWRRLARLVDRPVVRPVARMVYDRIAAPALYALHRRRQAKALAESRSGA